MAKLKFRIILVPQEILNADEREELLFCAKSAVQNCGFTDICINFSQFKKYGDDNCFELKEFAFDVLAKVPSVSCEATKVLLYKGLCINWKKDICSYIEFFENDCFVESLQPYHELICREFSFGVLPHNGHYYKCSDDIFEYTEASFYHDTRNVIITVSIEKNTYEITFSYDNIRNLFVGIECEPCHVYFDLINPPIIYRMDKRKRHRSNCIKKVLNSKIIIGADIIGRANVLSLKLQNSVIFREIIASIHHQCAEKSVFYSRILRVSKFKQFCIDPVIKDMDFGCCYLINAIFKRNLVMVSQASDINTELSRLYSWSRQHPECLEKSLAIVLVLIDDGKILNFWRAVELQYEYFIGNKDKINSMHYVLPPNCFMIRRAIITPTRQLFWPTEVMFGSRFLRNFDPEYPIRVSFREDDMSKLTINLFSADPEIMESCVTKNMKDGLRIGSRKYDFLAWSSSQLREHGVWMYAKNENKETSTYIRDSMGDFSHIHCIPKYMARMGQWFSSTEDAIYIPLNSRFVKTEDDIEGGYDKVNKKRYCFSDGVGKISPNLASKVHECLGHDKLCSAFQIRYKGYKGVLVIDPTLEGEQIVFRKSMKKFDCSNSSKLEIVKTSKPCVLRLNRPLIAILNGLGVSSSIFQRLQEKMLQTLMDMMFDEEKAAKFLQDKTPTSLCNFKEITSSGIHLTTEPFFKSLLLALHRHRIERIKRKAQIEIDPRKGRIMLGVLDETNTLNYGEVFVQYSKDVSFGETTRDTAVLEGHVLVTKSPCIYPGDVRKLKAVDVPSLHHIVDCIVFPQRGPRPHPSEIAGSDLDGDDYAVIWDRELFFKANKEAADFPAVNVLRSNIGVSEIIHFFEEYIKNDLTGMIGNAHLIQADKNGIFSSTFQSICRKYSIALDFAKNGKIERLHNSEKPNSYPDFKENERRTMYKSDNALGRMYHTCKDFEFENETASIHYENVQCDPDLVYPGWEKYKSDAIMTKNKYNSLLKYILRTYGIQHEAEVVSGAFTKLHCRFMEKYRYEVEEIAVACIKQLNECMYREFLEEFTDADADGFVTSILQKASAWYVVTYSVPDANFLSFPWIVSEYLVHIKLRNKPSVSPPALSPAIMKLDEKIMENKNRSLLPYYEKKSEIWNKYLILCDQDTLDRALQSVILWGQEKGIIEKTGIEVHIQLLLHVAQMLGYITEDGMFTRKNMGIFSYVAQMLGYITEDGMFTRKNMGIFSSGLLLLEYLKFCSNFRFLKPEKIKKTLSFSVPGYEKLAKHAVASYYKFAISGSFQFLDIDERNEKKMIQMKTVYKNRKAFPYLKRAEYILKKTSEVNEISIREVLQTELVCISAKGTESAVRSLKMILEKSDDALKNITREPKKAKSK